MEQQNKKIIDWCDVDVVIFYFMVNFLLWLYNVHKEEFPIRSDKKLLC